MAAIARSWEARRNPDWKARAATRVSAGVSWSIRLITSLGPLVLRKNEEPNAGYAFGNPAGSSSSVALRPRLTTSLLFSNGHPTHLPSTLRLVCLPHKTQLARYGSQFVWQNGTTH